MPSGKAQDSQWRGYSLCDDLARLWELCRSSEDLPRKVSWSEHPMSYTPSEALYFFMIKVPYLLYVNNIDWTWTHRPNLHGERINRTDQAVKALDRVQRVDQGPLQIRLQRRPSPAILKLQIVFWADSKPRAQSMTVVDTEVFMVPKFKLDITALVGRKVIRGHIGRLSSASSLPRISQLRNTGIK
jgi:hypothetical protein